MYTYAEFFFYKSSLCYGVAGSEDESPQWITDRSYKHPTCVPKSSFCGCQISYLIYTAEDSKTPLDMNPG